MPEGNRNDVDNKNTYQLRLSKVFLIYSMLVAVGGTWAFMPVCPAGGRSLGGVFPQGVGYAGN